MTSLVHTDCCSEEFSPTARHLDCTYSLVVELLKGTICTDIVLPGSALSLFQMTFSMTLLELLMS